MFLHIHWDINVKYQKTVSSWGAKRSQEQPVRCKWVTDHFSPSVDQGPQASYPRSWAISYQPERLINIIIFFRCS